MDERFKYKHDIIKALEENIGQKISDIPQRNIFTNTSPRVRDIKERINKWDYINIKSFCTAKEYIHKMQREPTIWNICADDISADDTSDKVLIYKLYKELTRLHSRKTKNPIKKMGKGLEQTLLQGRATEGPETYEKMLNITSHQRDAN